MPKSTATRKFSSFIIWLLATGALGSLSFLIIYQNPENSRFLLADFDNLVPSLGLADSGSYLLGGKALAGNDMLGDYRWIFNLWPPGMTHLHSLILTSGLPIGLTMYAITCASYGLVVAFVFSVVSRSGSWQKAVIAALVSLLNPFAIRSLSPENLLYSDGLGSSFLALAMLAWLTWIPVISNRELISSSKYAGLIFAVSSIIALSLRWSMAPTVGLLWLVAACVAVGNWFDSRKIGETGASSGVFELLKAAMIALTMGLPWTIYVASILHPPIPFWSVGTDYVWAQRWLRDENLPGFLEAGNANWACDLDPEKCEVLSTPAIEGGLDYEIFRNEALDTIFRNPSEFILVGLSDFFRGFFSAPNTGVGEFNLWYLSAISALLISLAIVTAIRQKNWVGTLSAIILIVPTFLVISVFHIESRYLLPLHYFAFTVSVILIVSAFGSKRRVEI